MKETILLYGFQDETRLTKVKKALILLGMRMRVVVPADYSKPVGYMAGIKELETDTEAYGGLAFENEMMVMAGLSSSRVDAVILALRKAGIGRIDYKAVLTPTNQTWSAVTLYEEIAREHEAMHGNNGPAVS